MSPVAAFEDCPEIVQTEVTHVCNDRDRDLPDAFFVQREREMMAVDCIVTSIRAQNNGNVVSNKIGCGLVAKAGGSAKRPSIAIVSVRFAAFDIWQRIGSRPVAALACIWRKARVSNLAGPRIRTYGNTAHVMATMSN
jgi:hypothetical protein